MEYKTIPTKLVETFRVRGKADKRITQAQSPFVAISDLIEQLEIIGTEHSVAVGRSCDELVVVNPHTLEVVGVIDLTEAGAWARKPIAGPTWQGDADEGAVIWSNEYSSEPDYMGRSGTAVAVIAECDPRTYDVADTGTMFKVRFADGFIGEAFVDELDGDFIID